GLLMHGKTGMPLRASLRASVQKFLGFLLRRSAPSCISSIAHIPFCPVPSWPGHFLFRVSRHARAPFATFQARVNQVVDVGLIPTDRARADVHRPRSASRFNGCIPAGLAVTDLAQNLANANQPVRFPSSM